MFPRFAFALVMSVLVPILGLSSCSKDRTDDWSMSEPVLVGQALSLPISSVDRQTLPPNTQIKFKGSPWALLQITSTCFVDSKSYSQTFTLDYRDSIELKSLWPRELTGKVSDTELAASECDFKFVATNGEGSTHDFAVHGLKLSTFVNTSDPLLLRRVQSSLVSTVNPAQPAKPLFAKSEVQLLADVIDGLTLSLDHASEVSMICENSSARVPLSESSQQMIGDLLSKIQSSGVEYCHFLVSDAAADTNAFAISADAPLRFSSLHLDVTPSRHYPSTFGDLTLQRVVIRNSNSETSYFLAPRAVPTVRIREVYLSQNNLYTNPSDGTYQLKVRVQGAVQIDEDRYALAPSASATVDLTFESLPRGQCQQLMSSTVHAGLRWGFASAYSIQILEQADDVSGSTLFSPAVFSPSSPYPDSLIAEGLQQQFGATVPEWTPNMPPSMTVDRCF